MTSWTWFSLDNRAGGGERIHLDVGLPRFSGRTMSSCWMVAAWLTFIILSDDAINQHEEVKLRLFSVQAVQLIKPWFE